MTHTLCRPPRPPSTIGERPGTADVTRGGMPLRASTPGASCARTQTLRNFDLTPADTPGAPKPRKTRGRTPKAGECAEANLPSLAASPLFTTLMSSRMGASMQRPDSAMSSPTFESPTMPTDAEMMSFSSAFKDLSLGESKHLPPLPASTMMEQTDFGENYGVARRARLGVSTEGTPVCEAKVDPQQPQQQQQQQQQQQHEQQQHYQQQQQQQQEQEVVELVQRPGSRLGFASATGFAESPTSAAEGYSGTAGGVSSITREEQEQRRESHGGRPVPRNLFAADTSAVYPSAPHTPHPPPKR